MTEKLKRCGWYAVAGLAWALEKLAGGIAAGFEWLEGKFAALERRARNALIAPSESTESPAA